MQTSPSSKKRRKESISKDIKFKKFKIMNKKQEALNRLTEIEKETKELRLIIENENKPKPIKERVFDIASAISELGEADEEVISYRKMLSCGLPRKILSGQEIAIFCKAVNEGTKIDFSNNDQTKYFIWFNGRNKVSSGFVYYVNNYDYISASYAARHGYKSRDLAAYGAKCIEKIYYEYIME